MFNDFCFFDIDQILSSDSVRIKKSRQHDQYHKPNKIKPPCRTRPGICQLSAMILQCAVPSNKILCLLLSYSSLARRERLVGSQTKQNKATLPDLLRHLPAICNVLSDCSPKPKLFCFWLSYSSLARRERLMG